MRHLDIQDGILGYCDPERESYDEPKNQIYLAISETTVKKLVSYYSDHNFIGDHIQELARVYELVREGRI